MWPQMESSNTWKLFKISLSCLFFLIFFTGFSLIYYISMTYQSNPIFLIAWYLFVYSSFAWKFTTIEFMHVALFIHFKLFDKWVGANILDIFVDLFLCLLYMLYNYFWFFHWFLVITRYHLNLPSSLFRYTISQV